MLWSAGERGQCTFFNRPWLGFSRPYHGQEAGNGWVEGVHPDDRQRCLDTYRRAFDGHQPFEMEYRLQRADGQYSWIRDAGTAQFDKDGGLPGLHGFLRRDSGAGRATAVTPLTPREVQVLALVAEGHSTKEVAALLGISYKTADSHRSRIMEKLGVHETASLVRYAIRQGIVRAVGRILCGAGNQPRTRFEAGLAAWKGGCGQDWPPHKWRPNTLHDFGRVY